ncbi:glycosyltransferase family 4 protein [Anaerobranca gottschalkii]|uniref:Glycosyltransferase involved in cell wall bisynthesis n=1 Tax=Anaerobranca gottschalkii DSM 13577 TaxID=1120990 RepID=A0A1I0BEN9_9FIRM|nr:glycosyltransferase family 4 protein [Anaerobranca gottschalkii]SET04671.1 Glycosyltransferase involved in cell wall bisynthesis [Anaerobranca gottschalkii DSM 13577]
MKNIWILNHYAGPPEITDFGIRHYELSKSLLKKGYKVKIFTASSQHHRKNNLINDNKKFYLKDFNNVPFVFIKARDYIGNGKERILNMIDYTIGLLINSKYFSYEKPDIIIASSVHPLTWLAGYRLARKFNAKFIAETRDLWPETLVAMEKIKNDSLIAKILYKLEKFIYKNADKLIFTMQGGKDYIIDKGLDKNSGGPIDLQKVHYINNGIDLEAFNKNRLNFEYIDIDDNRNFKVIYTGSMGIANALEYLLDAAKIIQDKGFNDIKFVLFGDGYKKQELEEYTKSNNINNVVFKGRVEKKYIPNILSKSNLNVFLGKNIYLYKYGLSLNKMFDYFASGKPTLSNIECGYNILEQYNCGITVKGGSAEALAEGILKFYKMPKEEYEIYCQNALKAAQDFDYKLLAEKLEKVILED